MNWADHPFVRIKGGVFPAGGASGIDRSNLEDTYAIFKKLQQHLADEEYMDKRSGISLVILNDAGLTAAPLQQGGSYAIGISIGLLRAIWNLLLLTLCDPKIFPGYGGEPVNYRCKRRITKDMVFAPSITPATNSQKFAPRAERAKYQDITGSRRELCETLFNAIVDYVLYHEAMHITRDHLSFIRLYNEQTYINESEMVRGINRKFFQFLEIDADIVALGFNLESHPEVAGFEELSAFDKGDFVFGQMFSCIILQQLFDLEMEMPPVGEQWKVNHPPPLIRAMLYDNLLRAFFTQRTSLSEAEIRNQQGKAWWEASRIAIKLGFPKGRWHGNHIEGIEPGLINDLIDEFNAFQDVIHRSHESGKYEELEGTMRLLNDQG